ncbi:MAG: hypothetical protein A2020_01500 [Lentisphaerae bacterium GWF2_45_14]|nr:MAG: hypothetical protein A2020_01500 [Lentisphaerae bacterium GWF2_45_14]
MIVDRELSYDEKLRGQKLYKIFTGFNALSYICIADNLLLLFAISAGCPDYIAAVLAALPYLGFIFIFAGKYSVSRCGASNSIGFFWLLSNIAVIMMVVSPLIKQWAGNGYLWITVLIAGAFLFYSCRAAGAVSMQPLVGEIAFKDNRGKLTSGIYKTFNIMGLIGLGILVLLFRKWQDTWLFQWILIVGAVIGGISTYFIFSIKESPLNLNSARRSIKNDLRKLFKTPKYTRLMTSYILAISLIMMTVPISMLALKEGYMVPYDKAIFFALVQFAGGIFISYLSGILAEETGPRPLIILYCCILVLVQLSWIVAPGTFSWGYSLIIFLLCGCCIMGISLALMNYFLLSVEESDRFGTGLFLSAASGISAGLAGILISSPLLRVIRAFGPENPLDIYRIYFGVVLLLSLPSIYFISRLEKLKDWALKDVLALAFAPRDMKALLLISSLEKVADPKEEDHNIDKLENIRSGLSEKKLLSYLDSPKFSVRGKAMQALRQMPFGDGAKKALINELEYGEQTTAYIAAQILGENKVKEAIPLLLKALESNDNYLKGKAMVSLVQLEVKESYRKIEEIFKSSSNPRLIIHGAAALGEIGDPDAMDLLLDKAVPEQSGPILNEILLALSEIGGTADTFYRFLKHYKLDPENARSMFTGEVKKVSENPLTPGIEEILEAFTKGKEEAPGPLIDALLSASSGKKRKIAKIVNSFLERVEKDKLKPELIYCIVFILRKKGIL